jgi:choline dehydrogenase-like flavoprotein
VLFDANEVWPAADARYDVCVCGTGPAGMTVARKLASSGKRVLLLEAGGLTYGNQSQEIYDGTNIGLECWALTIRRLRYFGGTSNHWGGRCGIFDPIDFEQRELFGLPGWPISREDVLAHLNEAREILDLGDQNLDSPYSAILAGSKFKLSGFATSPPTRFATKYINEVKASGNIDAFVNANLVSLQFGEDGNRLAQIVVRNYKGDESKVIANQYVLALGAIENARILLNSDKQVPGGVGNGSDMVGRCFMEHVRVAAGRFLISDAPIWSTKPTRGIDLVPTDGFMREAKLGNGIISFNDRTTPKSDGRLRVFKQAVRLAFCESSSLTEVARQLVDYNCPGDSVIDTNIEQTPNADSRVTLDSDKDALGLRRVRLNWQLNDVDRHTVRTLAIASAKEMARLDLARVQLADFILDPDHELEVDGIGHHMGTTRMSASPQHGVVDWNSKVHGISNLYVAGSSVFPTGGGTNPTLTIVMLALRLADHICGMN